MTVKKAIEAMKFYKEKLYNGIFNQFIAAFDVAIEALEKQIPKKPIAEERKDYEGNIFEVAYRCPKCNRLVCCDYENDIKEEYPYCNCGQALDWSDTE